MEPPEPSEENDTPRRYSLWDMLSLTTYVSLMLALCLIVFGPQQGRHVIGMIAGIFALGGVLALVMWLIKAVFR